MDREGNHLYPAFPYDHFTKVSTQDLRAIYAFFMTREPVRAETPPNVLSFPYSMRSLIAGWKLLFFPGAEATHVYAASHKGRLFVENLRGQLRFLRKHRGIAYAERARRLLLVALRLRGLVVRGERGRMYRDGARWLASGGVGDLLE